KGGLRERSNSFDGWFVRFGCRKHLLQSLGFIVHLFRNGDAVAELPSAKTTSLREHCCTHNYGHHHSTRLPGSSSASEVLERCSSFFGIQRNCAVSNGEDQAAR